MNKNFEDLLTKTGVRYYSSYNRCYKYNSDEEVIERYSVELIREVLRVMWKAGSSPDTALAVQRYFDVMN